MRRALVVPIVLVACAPSVARPVGPRSTSRAPESLPAREPEGPPTATAADESVSSGAASETSVVATKSIPDAIDAAWSVVNGAHPKDPQPAKPALQAAVVPSDQVVKVLEKRWGVPLESKLPDALPGAEEPLRKTTLPAMIASAVMAADTAAEPLLVQGLPPLRAKRKAWLASLVGESNSVTPAERFVELHEGCRALYSDVAARMRAAASAVVEPWRRSWTERIVDGADLAHAEAIVAGTALGTWQVRDLALARVVKRRGALLDLADAAIRVEVDAAVTRKRAAIVALLRAPKP